ncbi:MAG: RsmE family RNA methyltransferase [Candidatus Omnitrophota bacterium]
MNRFFVDKAQIGIQEIRITNPDDVCHLTRSLRVKEGEKVYITDGEGRACVAQVVAILKAEIILKIAKTVKACLRCEQKITFSLACAVPKFAKFDEIVDKCTQLGVDEIIPLLTERVLVKTDFFSKKEERFKRVMMSAAKQSGTLFLPRIRKPVFFDDFVKNLNGYDLRLLPNLDTTTLSLKEAVSGFKGGRILIMIGPEGDFTSREIALAFSQGCQGISLGGSVLRVDTAAIAVLSYLRLFFEL